MLFSELSLSAPQRIDLFVDNADALNLLSLPANVSVWDLSLPEKTQAKYIPEQLPPNPTEAKAQVMAIMKSPQGAALKQEIKKAYLPLKRLIALGVEKTPAIVFDERFVVYGTLDVNLAMNDWMAYQQANGSTTRKGKE